MATATKPRPYAEREISTERYSQFSKAPNGSSSGEDFYTVITYLQTWHSGQYAGYTYKIVERWISHTPNYRGQYIGRSSSFHSGPAQ